MSRPTRSERLAAKGRPRRRAAKTHFFKYQLASNPSRAEENDLKRALQESLEEQNGKKIITNKIISSTNSSDVSRSNNSSFSNVSLGSITSVVSKRTRSSTLFVNSPLNKRAKLSVTNGQNECDDDPRISVESPTITPLPFINKAIRTYSRGQTNTNTHQHQKQLNGGLMSSTHVTKSTSDNANLTDNDVQPKISTLSSVSKSTQTPSLSGSKLSLASTSSKCNSTDSISTATPTTMKTTTLKNDNIRTPETMMTLPIQDQCLKFKRESKNYAYVKMTALKVSTSKSPSSNSKSSSSRKTSPNSILHNSSTNRESFKQVSPKASKGLNGSSDSTFGHSSSAKQTNNSTNSVIKNDPRHDNKSITKLEANSGKKSPTNISSNTIPHNDGKASDNNKISKTSKNGQGSHISKISIPKQGMNIHADIQGPKNDCSLDDTLDLSKKKNQNQANVKVTKKRLPRGSWSLLGVPEEKVIYLRDDVPPKRLICYPAIKHVEGDVIQVKDSVLLRSGARKTDLPYIAKVCALWEDAETGGVMMSLFWYYRPEHTEEGRKQHHLSDEIFASRHRDVDSVECIEDKCYVLTFNEYCRYRKRCKMEQVNTTWSLIDATIPVSNESYPRRNRIPENDVNPELVFCCRQIYDSRMKRLVKNPLINPKYGHI